MSYDTAKVSRQEAIYRFKQVRQTSETLCQSLEI